MRRIIQMDDEDTTMLTTMVLMAVTMGAPPIADQGQAAVRSIVAEIQADLPQRAAELARMDLPRPIDQGPLLQVVHETVVNRGQRAAPTFGAPTLGVPSAGGLND